MSLSSVLNSSGNILSRLDQLEGSTEVNSLDNSSFSQVWDWNAATTQNALTLNANALTTGTELSVLSSSNALNSINGLLSVRNTGASTNGLIARIQSNGNPGPFSGLNVFANGRIGINTNDPTSSCEVSGINDNLILGSDNTHGLTVSNFSSLPNSYSNIRFNAGLFNMAQITARFDNQTSFPTLASSLHFFTSIAGSMVNRMSILSNGNVGIGTSNPTTTLDVQGTIRMSNNLLLPTATSPTDGNFYFGGQTDGGQDGMRMFHLANNGGFIDVKASGTNQGLIFRVDQANGGSERMRIAASGNIGIQNASPAHILSVGNSATQFSISNFGDPANGAWIRNDGANMVLSTHAGDMYYGFGGNAGKLLRFGNAGSQFIIGSAAGNILQTNTIAGVESMSVTTVDTGMRINFTSGSAGSPYLLFGNTVGSVTFTGAAGVLYNTTSDARLKTDTGLNPKGLDELMDIKVHNFTWDETGTIEEGFFAQELHKIVPSAVTVGSDEVDENGKLKNTWKVDHGRLTPILVKSIQELTAKVTFLEEKLKSK